jgi:hypothetical protein
MGKVQRTEAYLPAFDDFYASVRCTLAKLPLKVLQILRRAAAY